MWLCLCSLNSFYYKTAGITERRKKKHTSTSTNVFLPTQIYLFATQQCIYDNKENLKKYSAVDEEHSSKIYAEFHLKTASLLLSVTVERKKNWITKLERLVQVVQYINRLDVRNPYIWLLLHSKMFFFIRGGILCYWSYVDQHYHFQSTYTASHERNYNKKNLFIKKEFVTSVFPPNT